LVLAVVMVLVSVAVQVMVVWDLAKDWELV
jgi:hypothetical protein